MGGDKIKGEMRGKMGVEWIEDWEDLVPRGVIELCGRVRSVGGELWIYGEGLCELCLMGEVPRYIQLATSLERKDLLRALDIFCEDERSVLYREVLYYEGGRYFILEGDFLPDFLSEKYSMEIIYGQRDWLNIVERKFFSIERICWDFGVLRFEEGVRRDFERGFLEVVDVEVLRKDILLIFRLVRYGLRFEFMDFKGWGDGMKDNLEGLGMWKGFGGRVVLRGRGIWRMEWIKLMELEKPSEAFEYFRRLGVLGWILPELLEGYGVDQNEFHAYDVYYHNLKACDEGSRWEPLIRTAGLLHDIGKPRSKRRVGVKKEGYLGGRGGGVGGGGMKNIFYDHENIGAKMAMRVLRRFGFRECTVKVMSKLVRMHMFHYTKDWTDNAVRRFMKKAGGELEYLFKLRYIDRVASGKKRGNSQAMSNLERRIRGVREEDERVKVKDLMINGDDIMDIFSLEEGPLIGSILDKLLKIVLESPEKNDRSLLIYYTRLFLNKI